MKNTASFVLSAYSFINNLPLHDILDVGNQEKGGNPIPSFSEDILINLCQNAEEIFKKEDNVLKIDGDVIIVGDIHGSLHDLLRILKYIEKKETKVLFIGDYVDRGNFSLECITILFAMKILRPDSFYLIRGNHEFDSLCSTYGFKYEIYNHHKRKSKQKIEEEFLFLLDDENMNENYDEHHFYTIDINCYQYTDKLYQSFINAFSYLPIASIVNDTTFCVHGGLSPLLEKVDSLKFISRPITAFEENILLADLVWSDPSSSSFTPYRLNHRGCGYLFNEKAVSAFLKKNKLNRIIRAHQCVKNGISEHFKKKCITVFSASSYSCDMGNHSAILRINKIDDSIEYFMFPPIHRLDKNKALYYKFLPQKSKIYSMSHKNIIFKGKTSKIRKNSDLSKNSAAPEKVVRQKRDFNGLKIHCHVNPALAINIRKSDSSFVHFNSKKRINHSISLPDNLLIKQDDKF